MQIRRCDRSPELGQVLVEFLFCSILSVILITAFGGLLFLHWSRVRCVYFAFEAVHRSLIDPRFLSVPPCSSSICVELIELPDRIQGKARCGRVVETVELPRLENAQW